MDSCQCLNRLWIWIQLNDHGSDLAVAAAPERCWL